jgi:hypothetical protein
MLVFENSTCMKSYYSTNGRTEVKNNTSELKLGWLEEDMKRAAQQVAQWKIKKFEELVEEEVETHSSSSTSDEDESQGTLSC